MNKWYETLIRFTMKVRNFGHEASSLDTSTAIEVTINKKTHNMIGRVEVTLKAEDCRGWRQQTEKLCHRADQQTHFKGHLAPPGRRMMLLCK